MYIFGCPVDKIKQCFNKLYKSIRFINIIIHLISLSIYLIIFVYYSDFISNLISSLSNIFNSGNDVTISTDGRGNYARTNAIDEISPLHMENGDQNRGQNEGKHSLMKGQGHRLGDNSNNDKKKIPSTIII